MVVRIKKREGEREERGRREGGEREERGRREGGEREKRGRREERERYGRGGGSRSAGKGITRWVSVVEDG